MITDDQAEAAVEYLKTSAISAAQARANRIYLEQWIKTVLAQETAKSGHKTATERDTEARSSSPYLAALQAYREAVEADEKHRFLREAAVAKVEAWRTLCSNARAA